MIIIPIFVREAFFQPIHFHLLNRYREQARSLYVEIDFNLETVTFQPPIKKPELHVRVFQSITQPINARSG